MARGGKRQGAPGQNYGNRSDLNAPKVDFEGDYGDDVEQAPLQKNRSAPAPVTGQRQGPAPGSLTSLDAPTMRPNEPLTAGLPTGPGPGPEALGMASRPEMELRSIYQQTGNEAIRELIEALEEGR